MLSNRIEAVLQGAGLQLLARTRTDHDNGTRLRFKRGEIVTVFDNGTVSVQGQHQRQIKSLLKDVLGPKSVS